MSDEIKDKIELIAEESITKINKSENINELEAIRILYLGIPSESKRNPLGHLQEISGEILRNHVRFMRESLLGNTWECSGMLRNAGECWGMLGKAR